VYAKNDEYLILVVYKPMETNLCTILVGRFAIVYLNSLPCGGGEQAIQILKDFTLVIACVQFICRYLFQGLHRFKSRIDDRVYQ
jgi:hypothetical protein